MAKSRRRSIYPIVLIALVNGLVFAGGVVPLAYYGFEEGPPVDLAAAGWVGWTSLVLAVIGLAILIVGGVFLRAIPKIPALTMAVYPASVAAVGLIGAQMSAGVTVEALAATAPAGKLLILGLGLSEALNATVITNYVAAMLMMGGALTVALRHWPSRSSLSSGGKLGLMGGAFLLVGLIVASFFWAPLAGLGALPWITAFVGLVAIAMAAHAIRNDPTDEANVQAAGELWVTLLLGIGGLVFVCTARHTGILMEGLATLHDASGQAGTSALVDAWSAAQPALHASALYAVPLLFAAISSMLSRESLGSWGLRNAAPSLLVVPIFFIAPTALAYAQTAWAANAVAKLMACSAHVLANPDVTIPTTSAALRADCPSSALEVGRTRVMIGDQKLGLTEDLDSSEGCAAIASKVEGFAADYQGYVVTDESVSYRRVACLVDALAESEPFRRRTALFEQLHPEVVGREGVVVAWVLKAAGAERTNSRPPFDALGTRLVTAPGYGPAAEGWDPNLIQMRIFEGGWELQRAPKAKKTRFEGTVTEGIERLKKALGVNFDAHVVVLRADANVRMGVVLRYASRFKYPQLALPRGLPHGPSEPAGSAVPPGSAAPTGSATPPGSALAPDAASPTL